MKNDKKRLGFLTYHGWARGICYTKLMYFKMLQDDYDLFILKQFLNPIEEEFKKVNVHITENETYNVDPDFFRKWIKDNKLDAVFFEEYNQWEGTIDEVNLVQIAKEEGCKTFGYLVMEKFKPSHTRYYDRLICPTVSMMRFYRFNKVRNFSYMPTSIDFNEFPKDLRTPSDKPEENGKFTFFHPGGFGEYKDRKNTVVVI